MKIPDQEKQIRKWLDRGGCDRKEIAKVMKAVSELRQQVPRLSAGDVDRVALEAAQKMEEMYPALKQPTAKDKLQKAANDIAISLVATGIWELLVYVSHHVGFYFGSAGEDWQAADRARAESFKPTKLLSNQSQVNLSNNKKAFFAWRQEYLNEVFVALKGDADLYPAAQIVSESCQMNQHQIDTFFYDVFLNNVLGLLVKEGESLCTDQPPNDAN